MSLIAFEKFRQKVVDKGYSDKVKLISSIYDSVYLLVKKDKEVVEWVNKALHEELVQDYIYDQPIPLQADMEISYTNWAEFEDLVIEDLKF